MYAHSGDAVQYGLVPTPEVQLARDLFKTKDTKGMKTGEAIVEIAYRLYNSPTKETIDLLQHNIQDIIKYNKVVEDSMADFLRELARMWRESKDSETSKATQVKDSQSLAFLIEIANKHGIQCPQGDYDKVKVFFEPYIQNYQQQYPVPLQMMVDFCKKCTDPHFIPDKPERVNQVWDQRILHVAGQCIKGKPIILVTDDKAMLEAANNSEPSTSASAAIAIFSQIGINPDAVSNNVMSYSDYIAWLELKKIKDSQNQTE